ncbi:hypothetical protein HY971_05230, partial [Candidatus Kaiserbacteria bacterium]|nr:hypothetical protein [Candidatus Kaiserbacteria bacterium]
VAPGATFTVAWSSSNATSCNLTNAQGQTSSTSPNTTGSSQGAAPAAGQTFTYTLACTNSGGTTTKTATVTGQTVVATNVGACTYKGQSYAEGATKTIQVASQSGPPSVRDLTMTCDNGAWITTNPYNNIASQICSASAPDGTPISAADFGCPGNPISVVNPRHGRAPLTVTIGNVETGVGPTSPCKIYDLAWGDGTTVVLQPGSGQDSCGSYYSSSYTYKASGPFVISLQARDPWGPTHPYGEPTKYTANIRVDGPVASTQRQSPNQSQLASALVALESALQALLNLLR